MGIHQYTDVFQNLTPEEQTKYSTIAVNEQNSDIKAKLIVIGISIIKKIGLVLKIILSPLLCVALILLFQKLDFFKGYSFYLTIASFGMVITFTNVKKIKYNLIINLISSISLCFIVLYSSLFICGGLLYLSENLIIHLDIINDAYKIMLKSPFNIIAISILLPFLMFLSYRLLFKIKKNKWFKIIVIISMFVLLILRLARVFILDIYLFIFWQFVMALALQLILYQKELKQILSKKI